MAPPAGTFWSFSLAVYDDPAVRDECLGLQDHHCVNVNLLLFCAFLGAQHHAVIPAEALKAAAEAVRPWQRLVVTNLRGARRALKPFATDGKRVAAAAASLRAGVKQLELEAERIEQTMLEEWALAALEAWPRAKAADAIDANVETLLAEFVVPPRPDPPRHLIAAALENALRQAH